MAKQQARWKGIVGDWTHIQGFSSSGTLACLSAQQRQTILTFIQVAYWRTRWENAPSEDILNAFMSQLEDSLMSECNNLFTIRQTGCTIQLLVDGIVVSSFELDAEECGLLNAGGEGTKVEGEGETAEDKKTPLFSGAMALVIYCQEAIIDAFNAIEAEIEIGKAATVWMETVPGLDLSPAYEVLQACDAFNEMLESIFESTDTPEWREDMACKIMCWCVENNYTFDSSVIDTWREYLTDIGFVPPDYFYSNFVDVASYKALIDRFSLGMNDENEDWMTLCDDCWTGCGLLTFDDTETDMDYVITYGTIEDNGNPNNCINAEEFYDSPEFPYGRRIVLTIELAEVSTVGKVSWDFYLVKPPGAGPDLNRQIEFLDAEEEVIDTWQEVDQPTESEWLADSLEENVIEGVSFLRFTLSYRTAATGTREIRADNIQVGCAES